MQIDPLLLPALILSCLLGGLLLAATLYDLRLSRRQKSKNETVYRCAACRRLYCLQRHTPLARCPHCGESNEPARN
jgi:rRNA maturation endonuclease Nob1